MSFTDQHVLELLQVLSEKARHQIYWQVASLRATSPEIKSASVGWTYEPPVVPENVLEIFASTSTSVLKSYSRGITTQAFEKDPYFTYAVAVLGSMVTVVAENENYAKLFALVGAYSLNTFDILEVVKASKLVKMPWQRSEEAMSVFLHLKAPKPLDLLAFIRKAYPESERFVSEDAELEGGLITIEKPRGTIVVYVQPKY